MKKKKIILLSEPSRMLMKKSKEKRIYIYYNIYHHISVKEVYVYVYLQNIHVYSWKIRENYAFIRESFVLNQY